MTPDVRYFLDDRGRFVVEDYNWAVPFSDFFPGIADLWGIPAWVYWVNRAQAIVSLGVRDKDHQILEFQSFNRACQVVPHEGFRTFLRLDGQPVIEPFRRVEGAGLRQRLLLSPGELELEEVDPGAELAVEVAYYPLVNLPVAGLVRELSVRNTGARARRLECLDGVPRILPCGMNQGHIKGTPRHVEAMMGVFDVRGMPTFRLKQTASDREQIELLSGGNFYAAVGADGRPHVIVDPQIIFGDLLQHLEPWGFMHHGLDDLCRQEQIRENQTPSAFAAFSATLPPGGAVRMISVLGHAATDAVLERFVSQSADPAFFAAKRAENRAVLERITALAFTASAEPRFDLYCGQDQLDNVMRGGMPLVLRRGDRKRVFYVYCRQNGDLERDYHHFVLESTYLSQGTGHYRSILQNRRTDAWFFPAIEDANVRWFVDLLQLDGYNPLEVRGLSYTAVETEPVAAALRRALPAASEVARLLALVARPFTPGELAMALEAAGVGGAALAELVAAVVALSEENELGALHEGFWIDHWHYNLDTIELFLMVYPDRLRQLLVGDRDHTFFDNPDVVLPRSEKCVLRADGEVRRYGAVARDARKLELIGARREHPYRVRTRHGVGEIYRTTLATKLLCVVANRIATLDPSGLGVDMESDKPGWNDSMNGLPGLFGSSLCETLELERACRFLERSLAELGDVSFPVFRELADFIDGLEVALDRRGARPRAEGAFAFWDESNRLQEVYREQTLLGIAGEERDLSAARARGFLAKCLAILTPLFDEGERAAVRDARGVPYTYFVNQVTAHEAVGRQGRLGHPLVRPTRFASRPVPLFLEGPMHFLRVHPEQARATYQAVRASALFDDKLGMYKSCEDMSRESFELGRAVGAYPRGWLENESIYLHMEYKYLLEVLRAGLHEEFYRDCRRALVPFMDPAVYGRSILEGGSFIVSSAYGDERLHGRGFQPRLSGITSEMLHMWILMVAGPGPFSLGPDGQLRCALRPALAAWLFTRAPRECVYRDAERGQVKLALPANAFAFMLLGSTLVVYHNPTGRDTFGRDGVSPREQRLTFRDGSSQLVVADSLGPEPARAVREGRVERIDVTLG